MLKTTDGNKACSDIAYLFSEICTIYPITPSSPMASNIDNLATKGKLNIFNDTVKVVEMQSEAGAAGAMHGALISGSLATTFSSSQGLLLMIPNMYKMAGEMLPGVIHVAARSLSTHALSIFGDHQDVYATRATGFCILASSNVEDARNLALVAHLSAINGSLPFLHFFDGFRTSHEVNTIEDISEEKLKDFINKNISQKEINNFRKKALNVGNAIEKGMAQNEDIYFQVTESRNLAYEQIISIVSDNMVKVGKLFGINYQPFNYYGHKNATNIIVAMGSVCDTIKLVIDDLVTKDEKVGLIEVHLYRPFSKEHLLSVLPKTASKIAVLDRTKEAGSYGEPLYLDILNALKDKNIKIVGGRYGLSSKNTSPADIKSVYTMLDNKLQNNFTIGIIDDVTNLSLPKENYKLNLNTKEILVYGFGGDGMVSASKSVIDTLNKINQQYVQGYFQYDSKKSAGVTVSNLRISDQKINAPYYVENPEILVVTKDEYLNKFRIVNKLKDEGILILNTHYNFKELNDFLNDDIKEIMINKKTKLIMIDAEAIATKNNIKGKINKIIETIILKELNINGYKKLIKESIYEQFKNKGQEVIDYNIAAVDETIINTEYVKEEFSLTNNLEKNKENMFTIIEKREGDKLKVSDVYNYRDGTFIGGTSKHVKTKMSIYIPKWIKEKCIACMQCSFVCPHAVIRPFVIDKNHKYFALSKPLLGQNGKYFVISVSEDDCTSCGHCINVCPTNALEFGKYDENNQNMANYLFNNHENPSLFDKYSIKGSQLRKPKFEFAGACAGCGETPYIKLLTQLFGNRLVIANATGCSSIYGGSMPITPYSIPWASSLFEDNAEFGYGIHLSYQNMQKRIKEVMLATKDSVSPEIKKLYSQWVANQNDLGITYKIKEKLSNLDIPKELENLLDYLPTRSLWMIGGDGWAYDIGFGGIDHVLASNENINILVLDTEVYSNTGGQSSKSSRIGQIAEFAELGKKTNKKDLFKYVMGIPNVYVASICLGADPIQTIKAFKEAQEHNGPSIIIAYAPCVEQGIRGGMNCSLEQQKLAVNCGYLLLMRHDGQKLFLDSKTPEFDKYEVFLENEIRYNSLKLKNKKLAEKLLEENKQSAIDRYKYYSNLIKK